MNSHCTCVNLRRASQAVTALYDEALAPSGLRVTQYSLLRAVERLGNPNVGQLARELDLDRTTLSRNLQPLVRNGLLSLAPGGDPRARAVALTVGGRDALAQAVLLWGRAQAQVRSQLGDDALNAMLSALASLRGVRCRAKPETGATES